VKLDHPQITLEDLKGNEKLTSIKFIRECKEVDKDYWLRTMETFPTKLPKLTGFTFSD
jgi:hypothetical protein